MLKACCAAAMIPPANPPVAKPSAIAPTAAIAISASSDIPPNADCNKPIPSDAIAPPFWTPVNSLDVFSFASSALFPVFSNALFNPFVKDSFRLPVIVFLPKSFFIPDIEPARTLACCLLSSSPKVCKSFKRSSEYFINMRSFSRSATSCIPIPSQSKSFSCSAISCSLSNTVIRP